MFKKLGIVVGAVVLMTLTFNSPQAGAFMPNASPNDTCFDVNPTVDTPTPETVKRGNITYQVFRGTPGDDVIIGTDGPEVIIGNGGWDRICGRGGNDEIYYHPETPAHYAVNTQSYVALIDAGYGNDYVGEGGGKASDATAAIGGVYILGGPGDDHLWGTTAPDAIFANEGVYSIMAKGSTNPSEDDYCNVIVGYVGSAHDCGFITTVAKEYSQPTAYKKAATSSSTNATTNTTSPSTTTTVVR